MQTCTKIIRFLFVILSLSLLTAACTPFVDAEPTAEQETQVIDAGEGSETGDVEVVDLSKAGTEPLLITADNIDPETFAESFAESKIGNIDSVQQPRLEAVELEELVEESKANLITAMEAEGYSIHHAKSDSAIKNFLILQLVSQNGIANGGIAYIEVKIDGSDKSAFFLGATTLGPGGVKPIPLGGLMGVGSADKFFRLVEFESENGGRQIDIVVEDESAAEEWLWLKTVIEVDSETGEVTLKELFPGSGDTVIGKPDLAKEEKSGGRAGMIGVISKALLERQIKLTTTAVAQEEAGERTWQENLSPEVKMALAVATAETAEAKRQAAVEFAEYLNQNVTGDRVVAEFSHEITGDIEVGWDPAAEEWVEITPENREQLDLTGETFPELFAAGWTDEQGGDVFIDQEGQEIVLEKKVWPGVGEFSLAELILMGRNNELQVAGQTRLSLEEYTYLLMVNAKNEDGERYDNRLSDLENYNGGVFALPAVLEQGYYKGPGATHAERFAQMRYAFGGRTTSGISFIEFPNNDILAPVVGEVAGKAQIVTWIRVYQAVDPVKVLNQFELVAGGDFPTHRLMGEGKYDTFGGKNDIGSYPPVLFYEPNQSDASFTINHKLNLLEDDPGIMGERGLSAVVEAENLSQALGHLIDLAPRMSFFRPEFWLVNR